MDKDLRLGWVWEKNEVWYLQVIADIILIITSKNNILPENTVFFGTSGGGFMSIMLTALLKKSTAIANNPQTNVQKWCNFDEVISVCFDNSNLDSILEFYGHRFDVIKYFKKEDYIPPITYMFNTGEKTDITKHLLPFVEGILSLENFKDQINIVLYHNKT